ncbi:hypothetical protein GCM10028798_01260 [Humibacter antri]
MPAGKTPLDAHGSPSSYARHPRESGGALWRVRSRAQIALLVAMAGTIAIVAALVGVIVGIAVQGPAASVRSTLDAGPASSVSRTVSWTWSAGDPHPSAADVRAVLRKKFAGLPVIVTNDDEGAALSARWAVTPDAARIRPDQLASVRRAEARLGDIVSGLPGMSDTSVSVSGGGLEVLARMEQANAALSAVLPVPASVLAVAGVIALSLLAQLLVDARDNETRLLRARGASVRVIVAADAVEIAVSAVAGCLVGAAAALVALALTVGVPAPAALLLPGIGVLLGSVAVVLAFSTLAAVRASGEARQLSGRARLGISAGATLVLLAMAAISMWRFVQGQASVGPIDPIAVIAPAAVLCALATFAVIFFAPVSAAIETGVSRAPGVASLPMRSVSRHAAVFAAPVALLTLAVAVSTFASGYQATWVSFLSSSSRLVVGADARLDLDVPQFVGGPSDAVPLKRIAGVHGVSVAAPAMTIPAQIGPLAVALVGVRANELPALSTVPDAMFNAKSVAGALTGFGRCVIVGGACMTPDPGRRARGDGIVGAAADGMAVPAGAKQVTLTVRAGASEATTAHITAWLSAPSGEVIPVSADDVAVSAVATAEASVPEQRVRLSLPEGAWTISAFDLAVDLPSAADTYTPVSLRNIRVSIESASVGATRLTMPRGGWQLQDGVYENGGGIATNARASDLGFDGNVASSTATSVRARLASGMPASPVPVAISSALAAQTGLRVGSTTSIDLPQGSVQARVAVVTPQVPGTDRAAAALVDLPTLTAAMLRTSQDLPAVDTVFVAAQHDARLDTAALKQTAGSGTVVTPDVALPTRFIGPVVLALELGAYGCCALAVVALAASLAALWRRRRSETVILRAIGFRPHTQAATRSAEAALAVGYAIVCGVLAGIVVTLVAGNALARRSVPGAPTTLPVVGTFDLTWLIGCLAVLLALLALVVVRYAVAQYRTAVRAVPGRTTT